MQYSKGFPHGTLYTPYEQWTDLQISMCLAQQTHKNHIFVFNNKRDALAFANMHKVTVQYYDAALGANFAYNPMWFERRAKINPPPGFGGPF
jgi:hypothetical protein